MNRSEFEKKYWNYYRHLENKFMGIEPYVYFDKNNFNVYSYELISLLQAVGAEVDVLFKDLCGYPGDKNKNMSHYRRDILIGYQSIMTDIVHTKYFDVDLIPFADLATGMAWWQNFTAIKHDRQQCMQLANMETVLTALAGLFLLNRHLLCKRVGTEEHHFIKESDLFTIKGVDAQPKAKMVTRSNGNVTLMFSPPK